MNGNRTKVIIDTNLWISFLIGQKSLLFVRRLLTDESITVVMTEILRSEILNVASRPKFSKYFAPEAISRLDTFLTSRCENYSLDAIPKRCRDPKDDYLLELARVADADILFTGDKDLTDMGHFGRCRIMTIADLRL